MGQLENGNQIIEMPTCSGYGLGHLFGVWLREHLFPVHEAGHEGVDADQVDLAGGALDVGEAPEVPAKDR